jgi:D-serine deaminase-like pyridoxal phosphate-dependent protein
MTSLPDAERDASEVVRLLIGLATAMERRGADLDDEREILAALARDGGAAAARVLEYLRVLQGAGDGEAAAVPARLGPWRDWVPPRGNLFGGASAASRMDGLPRPRHRRDPGE